MSEKAVGTDWRSMNAFTLRHAAGAKKFLEMKKEGDKREEEEGETGGRGNKESICNSQKAIREAK